MLRKILELPKKALRLLLTRPAAVPSTLGMYWRFTRTRWIAPLFLTPRHGIFLGSNVRVQSIFALSAERPSAEVRIGDDSIVYERAKIEAYGHGRIEIGQGSIIGDARIVSRGSIKIGARLITSWNVFIQDFDPHPIEPELRRLQMIKMTENFRPSYRKSVSLPDLNWTFSPHPIVLGDDIWIGANVTILKGARIGDGCVVATGAVVTAGEYPARSILAGAPARVVKTLPAHG